MPQWRYWLIDLPAHITEVGFTWYRLYLLVMLAAAALVLPVMVFLTLAAYLFGW